MLILWLGFFVVFLGLNGAAASPVFCPPAPFAENPDKVSAKVSPMQMTQSGINYGSKRFLWSPKQPLLLTMNERPYLTFDHRLLYKPWGWHPIADYVNKPDLESKSLLRTGEWYIDGKETRTFVQKVNILPDGKISVNFDFGLDGNEQSKGVTGRTLSFLINMDQIADTEVLFDGTPMKMPPAKEWLEGQQANIVPLGVRNAKTIVFNPQNAQRRLELIFPKPVYFGCQRMKNYLQVTYAGTDHPVEFVMDLGEEQDASAGSNIVSGINNTANNDYSVAVYDEDGNMLMNPELRSGTRYFRPGGDNINQSDMLCTTEAKFGKSSLQALKYGIFSLMSIPVLADTPYTLSLYAKTSDGKVGWIAPQIWGYAKFSGAEKRETVPADEWKRLQFTFKRPDTLALIRMLGSTNVLIDGLQLEKGATATEYKPNPYGLEMQTDSPFGPVVGVGTEFNARLVFRGPAGSKGRLKVSITDFFKREIYNKELAFSIPDSEEQSFSLLEDNAYPRGVNTIKVEVLPAKGRSYTDFLRLNVAKFANGTAPNREIHAHGTAFRNWTTPLEVTERMLELNRNMGIGAFAGYERGRSGKPEPGLISEASARLKKYGFVNQRGWYLLIYKNFIDDKGNTRYGPYIGEETGDPQDCMFFGWKGVPFREMKSYPDEFLDAVDKAVYRLARKYPEVKWWNLITEPDGLDLNFYDGNYDEYAKLVVTIQKAIKRAVPDAEFRGTGACNIYITGRTAVCRMIEACKKLDPSVENRALQIHTYRPFPEDPDIETDFTAFLGDLKKLGYHDPKINLGEGAYFYPLICSQWNGVAPWAGTGQKDSLGHFSLPSYDLGWGERVGAAMLMRYWLFAYKHKENILQAVTWCPPMLDQDHPFAWMLMSAALTEILGDAHFVSEIRFFPDARGMIFEDGKGRNVAACWYFDPSLDYGTATAPVMELDLAQIRNVEFLDMMGNLVAMSSEDGKYSLPLSNFPVFVRTPAGTGERLAEALGKAEVHAKGKAVVSLSARLTDRNNMTLSAINTTTGPKEVSLSIGTEPFKKIALPPMGIEKLTGKLNAATPFDRVAHIDLPVRIRHGQSIENLGIKDTAVAIHHVSEKPDWERIPAIPFQYQQSAKPSDPGDKAEYYASSGPKDFAAQVRTAWSEKGLYMRLEITDDQLCIKHEDENPGTWYFCDGIQIFIDTMGDAKMKAQKKYVGFDENDYSYEVLPVSAQKAVVYRRHAPDHQLTGGAGYSLKPNMLEPGIPCEYEYKDGKATITLFFPAAYLRPLEFKIGSTPGFGILCFDRDSMKIREKQTLRTTEIHPFGRPDGYVTVLFAE